MNILEYHAESAEEPRAAEDIFFMRFELDSRDGFDELMKASGVVQKWEEVGVAFFFHIFFRDEAEGSRVDAIAESSPLSGTVGEYMTKMRT